MLMYHFLQRAFGNPSSVYDFAAKNKKAVNDSRQTIADALHADVRDIYFTAGGSESDNWALIATAEAYENKGKHIITSKIEHMPFYTPVIIWNPVVLRSHILMSMKMVF